MKYILYKSGYKYQLSTTYIITIPLTPPAGIVTDYIALTVTGTLIISAGYAWDGASGPALDSIFGTKAIMRGALVHDALYQLIRLGLLPETERKKADDILRDICLEDGMTTVRAWYVWKAVRMFGGIANKERPIMHAP